MVGLMFLHSQRQKLETAEEESSRMAKTVRGKTSWHLLEFSSDATCVSQSLTVDVLLSVLLSVCQSWSRVWSSHRKTIRPSKRRVSAERRRWRRSLQMWVLKDYNCIRLIGLTVWHFYFDSICCFCCNKLSQCCHRLGVKLILVQGLRTTK